MPCNILFRFWAGHACMFGMLTSVSRDALTIVIWRIARAEEEKQGNGASRFFRHGVENFLWAWACFDSPLKNTHTYRYIKLPKYCSSSYPSDFPRKVFEFSGHEVQYPACQASLGSKRSKVTTPAQARPFGYPLMELASRLVYPTIQPAHCSEETSHIAHLRLEHYSPQMPRLTCTCTTTHDSPEMETVSIVCGGLSPRYVLSTH